MRIPTLAATAVATLLALALAAAPGAALPSEAWPSVVPTAPATMPDFDGDGAPDIAIGGVEDLRTVQVRYATGRTQVIARKDLDGSAAYTGFGSSLLARDLNGDGYADLVIADAGDRQSAVTQAVFLVPGSAGGLQPSGAQALRTPPGLDAFVTALALVEEPFPVLVLGVASDRDSSGSLVLWRLGADGRASGGPVRLSQDSPGVPGASEKGDAFGTSLASSGPLLLVGAPGEGVGRTRQAGAVTVLTQQADGSFTGTAVTQATRGVPGSAEAEDWFGTAVAAGDGYAVVGVPGEDGGRYGSAGRIQPFRISAGTLRPLPPVDQATRGVPGTVEPDDRFGAAVAITRPCSGAVGVLVGAPGEDVAGNEFAGAAWSIPLTRTATCGPRSYYRGHGLPGRPSDIERVGDAVAVLRGRDPSAADSLLIAGPGSEDGPSGSVYLLATPTAAATVAFAHLYSPLGISLPA